MSVTETLQALGSWGLKLSPNTPQRVLDAIKYFGHVAIHDQRQAVNISRDELLETARYVGVIRMRKYAATEKIIGGAGMAFWLGDEDEKGYTLESGISLTSSTFTAGVTALVGPNDALAIGTLHSVTGSFTGSYAWQSRRKALTDFCSYFSNSYGPAEWRVNNNGTVDAGTIDQLYVSDPKCVIARNMAGQDMRLKGLPGDAATDEDVEDFSTRVVVLAQGEGAATATGSADINPAQNPYKDLFGNDVVLTRLVSQSTTDAGNADASAQLQLNRFVNPKSGVSLKASEMGVEGSFRVGDYLWVWDPEAGLTDKNIPANEITFRGRIINPVKLRAVETTWPVADGYGVSYRAPDGTWYDLTDYVMYESGDTTIVVGGVSRSLLSSGVESVGGRPVADSSVPAQVVLEPIDLSTYQSDSGVTRARIILNWSRPNNTDGSSIIDGGRYEIRWRTSAHQVLPATWDAVNAYNWNQLDVWDHPIPLIQGQWNVTSVGFDTEDFAIPDLTPDLPYDVQVRAADNSNPPNLGAWSTLQAIQTPTDKFAPSTPAAPSVASSTIAVQTTHWLGKATGGTFNLEADIAFLQYHYSYTPEFECTADNILGKVAATRAFLVSEVPIVSTFNVEETTDIYIKVVAIDEAGNASLSSVAAQASALLVDDAHISSLTVSKVTAGTVNANWVQAGEFTTAFSGVRAGFNFAGFFAYDAGNNRTFRVDAATGLVEIVGKFVATDPINNPGDSVTIWPSQFAGSGYTYPTIEFETSGTQGWGPAYINAIPGFGSNGTSLGLNSGPNSETPPNNQSTMILGASQWSIGVNSFKPVPNLPRGGQAYGTAASAALELHPTDSDIRGGYYVFNNQVNIQYNLSTDGSLKCDWTMDDNLIDITRYGTENAGNGNCGVEIQANGIKMYAAGQYVANTRFSGTDNHAIIETYRYCGFSESEFRGQIDGAAGSTFGIRDDGGVNAILDVTGKASVYVKNFVIDHPQFPDDRYLVHACLEGPEARVEYEGEAIIEGWQANVTLPAYFESLVHEEGRHVQLTVALRRDEDDALEYYPYLPRAAASVPRNGKFHISSDGLDGTIVHWRVTGRRKDVPQFPVEPKKDRFERAGTGPYTWLEEKVNA